MNFTWSVSPVAGCGSSVSLAAGAMVALFCWLLDMVTFFLCSNWGFDDTKIPRKSSMYTGGWILTSCSNPKATSRLGYIPVWLESLTFFPLCTAPFPADRLAASLSLCLHVHVPCITGSFTSHPSQRPLKVALASTSFCSNCNTVAPYRTCDPGRSRW